MAIWQNMLGSSAIWRNTLTEVIPTQVHEHVRSPAVIWKLEQTKLALSLHPSSMMGTVIFLALVVAAAAASPASPAFSACLSAMYDLTLARMSCGSESTLWAR